MIIYLIRHGKTPCNEQKLYCGKTDVSLSELGRNELSKRREEVKYPKCKNNYTSGAKRTNETFEILYPETKYEERNEFWEYDFGDFELKSYEMIKEDMNYINWICDKTAKVSCPNGESRYEFYTRLKHSFIDFITELKVRGEEEALIVCHGGTIGTLLELFYDGSKDFFAYQPSCGGGYKLEIDIQNDEIKVEILEEF